MGGPYFAAAAPEGDERVRLRLLEDKLDSATIRRLARIGVGPGWRCLEVGGGGGSIARWLAAHAGSVVVTDLDPRFLGDLGDPKVEVRRHDITADPLESDAFDLVHCRALLMHPRDPEAALRRMVEALRPGGRLLAEESDYTPFAPVDHGHPAADAFTRHVAIALDPLRSEQIADPCFGRALPGLVARLGLEDTGNEGVTRIVRGAEPAARYARSTFDRLRGRLLAKTTVTETQLASFDAAFDDPSFAFVDAIVVGVWGRRPGARR